MEKENFGNFENPLKLKYKKKKYKIQMNLIILNNKMMNSVILKTLSQQF